MSDDPSFDLSLIARQLRLIPSEMGSLGDDMNVLTTIAMRQDHSMLALLTEVRAMHFQRSRLANRVRALDE